MQIDDWQSKYAAFENVALIQRFSPEFTTRDVGGTPNFAPSKDTRWGYLSVAATQEYVFCLYSGRLQQSDENFKSSKDVHVFDWNGNAICQLSLCKDAVSISVKEEQLFALIEDTPIRLYQFANQVEIMNAGGLYGNARPENFPTVNDYRNPIVSEAMKLLGYVNKFNRGVDRVQTVLKENGNPLAEFTVDKLTVFEVVVEESKSNFHGGTKSGTKSFDEIKALILELCTTPQSLADIAEKLGYSDKTKFRVKYIKPLLGTYIEMTIPDKPKSRLQRSVNLNKS
ncbi:MAG: BF3164 family lipoprotein [Tannerellaceae bacterium]